MLVFIMHHHYANDVLGWAGLTHQLAKNCNVIVNNTSFPSWNPKNLDLSRLIKPEPAEQAKVDAPRALSDIRIIAQAQAQALPQLQGNVRSAIINTTASVAQPTVSEIISEWLFWRLATYIRALTNSVFEDALDQMLETVAKVRNKASLSIRIDSTPPMSVLQTDLAQTLIDDPEWSTYVEYRGIDAVDAASMVEGVEGADKRDQSL
ncbi:hypothetical protein BDV12DRAFT_195946 [Aspergillus spectabilis]